MSTDGIDRNQRWEVVHSANPVWELINAPSINNNKPNKAPINPDILLMVGISRTLSHSFGAIKGLKILFKLWAVMTLMCFLLLLDTSFLLFPP